MAMVEQLALGGAEFSSAQKYAYRACSASVLFAVLIFAVAAFAQKHVAIINTVDDGSPSIDILELNYLTDRLRETAAKILPQKSYAVMTQQSILSLFASPEEMIGKCNELAGCLVKIGREIAADYIGQGRIGRLGNGLTIKVELYENEKGTLVSSFTGDAKDIYGLLSVLDEKAPDMFRRMPGVSGAPSIVGGISGVQSVSGGWEADAGKLRLVNLTTEPAGASLSFNGLPSSSCAKSPCKAELPEGKIRILAALEQYEIADTTVSVERNNQNINIKLKPNFGVLEIKSAYLDGMGRNEQWSLAINDKTVFSLENRLSPNKYEVKLAHRCYEDISFEVGINKGGKEVFDMALHIKPKMGGMVLSTERDGEPSSEPVFVNGKRVGETPFSGTVAACSYVELGRERAEAGIKLKHKETVTYKHNMPSSQEWLDKMEERRRRMEETEEKRREMEDAERRARHIEAMREEREKWEMRFIKIGWRIMGGFSVTPFGSTSEWFDMAYTKYEEMEKANWGVGGIFAFGFGLSLRLSDAMVLATELNYNFFTSNYYYGDDSSFMQATVYSNTVSVPVLLRLFIPGEIGENKRKGDYYFEVGYQFGFPFYSSADIKSGDSFIYGKIDDNKNFSEYRLKMDQAIVAGFGLRLDGSDFSAGFRFIYNWTKLDKYGSLNAPIALGITLAYDFY